MESTEDEFSSFTTKGRRTKRQRSLLAASASASPSYRHGGGGSGCSDNSYGSSSSASPTNDQDVMSDVTSEDEDMANCLILLAQGIVRKGCNVRKSKMNNNINNNIIITSNNNIGVYECKTCNKTFPSFQALGGHRTSHKKIKQPSTTTTTVPSPDHHDEHRDVVVDLGAVEFTSDNKKVIVRNHDDNNNNNKARVHECSICGSEFPSGQALGGHMRRHRPVAPSTITSVSPGRFMSSEASTVVIDTGGPRNILPFDLNLPAPDDQDDDHHMEINFVHVLPRPVPLVDCYY